jgi:peptidoglycan hydrolase-like protein with peptidoglycan-binding domain
VYKLLLFTSLAGLTFFGLSVRPASSAPAQKSASKKKPTASKRSSASSKQSTSKKRSTASRRPSKKRTVARRPAGQQQPSPERYREIQQALAEKGYFHGESNGVWGPDSIDALKRFQEGQSLTANGKIDSLSLIALGLGAKRETAQRVQTPTQPQP